MTAPLELSRRVSAERIGRDSTIVVEADAAECAAIAARLLLPGIAALRCAWTLQPGVAGMIEAQGVLQARVTQVCVVSLEPFAADVIEDFTVHFVVAGREGHQDDPDEPDELVYDGTTIELGEATVEQLALALDPYPRTPGATPLAMDADGAPGPFAALAKRYRLD